MMNDKKEIKLSLSTVFLIIALILIVIMAFIIFKLTTDNNLADVQIADLKAESQSIRNTLEKFETNYSSSTNTPISNNANNSKVENIPIVEETHSVSQNTTSSANDTVNSSSNIVAKSESEQTIDIAKEYVAAVNSQNWETISKYSSESNVNLLKDYKITNMTIKDYSKYEYINNSYVFQCDFTIGVAGVSKKDLGIGNLLCISISNGQFKVNSLCTGP